MAFFEVTLRQSLKGREIQNVFHLEDPTSLVPQGDIAGLVNAVWVTEARKFQTTALRYFQIRVRRILWPDPLATFVSDVDILGAISTSFHAFAFLAVPLTFHSELAGPKHRGRYFHGGITTGHYSDANENLNATGITFANAFVTQIALKFAGTDPQTGLHLVVAHKDNSTPTRVSHISYITYLTFLRSRKLFHGI